MSLLPSFQRGGFHIGLDMKAPDVDADIHPPIDPSTYQVMDRKAAPDALTAGVRKAIASAL